jgi:hypothetical protein
LSVGIHGRRYIKDDKTSLWFRVAAYFGSFVLLIFALNGPNFYLIGLALLPLSFLLASEAVGLKTGDRQEPPDVPRDAIYQSRLSPRKEQSILLGTAVAVLVFASYWAVAPALFGLPPAVFGSLAATSGLLAAFGVDAVYSFSEAVAEERFVRFAVVNGVIYVSKNAWLGIIGSVVIFWALHVSRYWNDPQAQGLILVSGAFLGYLDVLYQSILVSTLAHVIWNLTVSAGTALVVAAPGLGALMVGAAVFVAFPALAFAPVAVLAWRRPDLVARLGGALRLGHSAASRGSLS